MKIYKTDLRECKEEFDEIINAKYSSLEERDNVIKTFEKSHSKELTSKEFLNDKDYRKAHWSIPKGVSFFSEGEPENLEEFIVDFELNGDSYESACRNFPEDMTKSRTDWDCLRSYCDEYSSFFDRLKDFIK